jgi:hypothetical protein
MNRKHALKIVGVPTSFALTLTAALLLCVASAVAEPTGLNWGTEVNAGECDTTGSPVVNVTYGVVDSVDSGEGHNYWAFEDYDKRIQLWDQGKGAYCAVVGYQGRFTAVAGQQSPGDTGLLDGDENGTFQGGYRMVIAGELLDEPGWPTHGRAGVYDYGCDIAGNCPGAVNWIDQYFEPGYGEAFVWWGWIYHGGRYGTWVNSSDGNAGDIT